MSIKPVACRSCPVETENIRLREALEKIIKVYDDVWPMDSVVYIAREALQRAGGGE